MKPHCERKSHLYCLFYNINFYFTNMENPTETGYYWYKEPQEEVKMCYVYQHEYHKHLRIIFLDESRQSFPLSVIEPEKQFIKIQQPKF